MTQQPKSRMSSPNSIWLRSIRYLTHEGKPLPQLTSLFLSSTTESVLPLGVMAQTDNNRLIFWPILPNHYPQTFEGKRLTDHITLELSNGKSHSTGFDEQGTRHHRSNGWKLCEISGSRLKMWFSMLVRWSVIRSQDLQVEVDMATPIRDGARRENEFRKHAENFRAQHIAVLEEESTGDYVYTVFYLLEADTFDIAPIQQIFLGNIDEHVDGLPDGTLFSIQPTKLQIGTTNLLALTSTPIGSAKEEIVFGFPRGGI